MTGRGSPDITDAFWRSEWSRRKLEVFAVCREADRAPDLLNPLPLAATAWSALAAAESGAPAAVRELLLHPQVGSWAAYALRRRLGGSRSDSPWWVDFGGMHTLALAASATAGLTWRTRVPARGGRVMIPALGMARFAGVTDDAVIEAETEGGRIRLRLGGETVPVPADPRRDGPGWWGLRRVRIDGDLPLSVFLDDLDPFRDLADPEPPARLNDADFAHWTALLADAWQLLLRDHRPEAEAMANGIVSVVPLKREDGWGHRSASTEEAFGSIMVSPPPDSVMLAVALVHEFQHIILGGLIHQLTLGTDDGRLYYAPWRYDPRPLSGFMQGVFAFLGIADFWRQHRLTAPENERALASFEYAHARAQTDAALRVLRNASGLSDDGHALIRGLTGRCTPWLDDEVPAEPARLSRLALDSHRLGWHLRHQRPSDDDVTRLAEQWLAGEQPTGPVAEAELHPDPTFHWHDLISKLVRVQLAGRELEVPGLGPDGAVARADADLVRGDAALARDGYLEAIRSGLDQGSPAEIHAWTGLAMAVAATTSGPAAQALYARPDVIRAVHAALTARGSEPSPVALAGWIGDIPCFEAVTS